MFNIRYSKFKQNQSKKNGSALIYVFIVLLAVSILAISILSILGSNLKQAKYQQDKMQAYYLAYSGVEMAYSALLESDNAKLKELTRTVNPVLERKRQRHRHMV